MVDANIPLAYQCQRRSTAFQIHSLEGTFIHTTYVSVNVFPYTTSKSNFPLQNQCLIVQLVIGSFCQLPFRSIIVFYNYTNGNSNNLLHLYIAYRISDECPSNHNSIEQNLVTIFPIQHFRCLDLDFFGEILAPKPNGRVCDALYSKRRVTLTTTIQPLTRSTQPCS